MCEGRKISQRTNWIPVLSSQIIIISPNAIRILNWKHFSIKWMKEKQLQWFRGAECASHLDAIRLHHRYDLSVGRFECLRGTLWDCLLHLNNSFLEIFLWIGMKLKLSNKKTLVGKQLRLTYALILIWIFHYCICMFAVFHGDLKLFHLNTALIEAIN